MTGQPQSTCEEACDVTQRDKDTQDTGNANMHQWLVTTCLPSSSYPRRAVCLHPGGPISQAAHAVWCPGPLRISCTVPRLATASGGSASQSAGREGRACDSKPTLPSRKLTGGTYREKTQHCSQDSPAGSRVKTPRLECFYCGGCGFDPWLGSVRSHGLAQRGQK